MLRPSFAFRLPSICAMMMAQMPAAGADVAPYCNMAVAVARLVAAGPFEDASDAAERRDYATALRLWRSLADHGEVDAQYNLGVMYDKGQGVTRDYAVAVSWFRKAADQGFAPAQLSLGVMYENGLGVPQDFTTAARWYRRAADQGDTAAQLNLSVLYENGWGVTQNHVIAHMWFSLAAVRGIEMQQETWI
jgi:hypothetical protein